MRRAKIVATLGPASSSYEQIKAIIDAGVDVARMNLSHGSHDVHEAIYKNVRKAALDSGKSIVIYFLGNAQTWRGPIAKAVKKELNSRIKG
jgi:pyruvate kinase